MRKMLLLVTSLLLASNACAAGTLTITTAGFAAMPATAPPGWPTNLTWPTTGGINGTKTYTISDVDMEQMMAWIATNYNAQLVGNNPPPVQIASLAVMLAWLQGFINATINAVQQFHTAAPVPPPPIVIN